MHEPHAHAVRVLLQADGLDAALDLAAEAREMFAEQSLRDLLAERARHGVGAVDPADIDEADPLAEGADMCMPGKA